MNRLYNYQKLFTFDQVLDFDYVLYKWALENTSIFTLDSKLGTCKISIKNFFGCELINLPTILNTIPFTSLFGKNENQFGRNEIQFGRNES